jgi:uncharacterized protein (TIGR03663 family)
MRANMSLKIRKIDWVLVLFLFLAFAMRLLYLSIKPAHFDEGINGWFVDQMISDGYYRYDPTNYHGPLHFYLLFYAKLLFGRNIWALRLPSVLFGVGAVYLVSLFKEYIGLATSRIAVSLMAISCGLVFYSRYAIHESDLLFFSLLALLGFFRFHTKKDPMSLWQLTFGIVGMLLTKETSLIHLLTFGIAYFFLKLMQTFPKFTSSNSMLPKRVSPSFTHREAVIVVGTGFFLYLLFFTGFFLNFRGAADSLRSYALWFQTGQRGNGHEKSFFYWILLFFKYELAASLGLVFTLRVLRPVNWFLRLIAIYGVGILLAYSIIPYKTPWCIINLLWPFQIIFSYVIWELYRKKGSRIFSLVLISLFFIIFTFDFSRSLRLNFFHYDDEAEAYVYVQTFRSIDGILKKIRDQIVLNPKIKFMPFNILMESSWPIPWLLGDLWQGNFAGRPVPVNPDAAFILADANLKDALENRLKNKYFTQVFKLRASQGDSIAYFNADLFKDVFSSDSPMFKPKIVEPLREDQGLSALYFTNDSWKGESTYRKHVANIDFKWSESARPLPAPFSILFTGEILIPRDEPIVFSLVSEDGSALEIDGVMHINNLTSHSENTAEKLIYLTKGWHAFSLRYNDYGGAMMARLMWKISDHFEVIEPENFRPLKSSEVSP